VNKNEMALHAVEHLQQPYIGKKQ